MSRQELLRNRIAQRLNASVDNVDVFTVLHSPHNTNESLLDVRFSAHGSPYYHPEKLNAAILQHQEQVKYDCFDCVQNVILFYFFAPHCILTIFFCFQFERELGVSIMMVNIDECMVEKTYCESSCSNILNKSPIPYAVFTNTSSFVGVRAVVDPVCQCMPEPEIRCLNGGTRIGDRCVLARFLKQSLYLLGWATL